MKVPAKSRWAQIKLTEQGRSKMRTAIREHPSAAQFVRSSSAISKLTKAGLLDLAEKLEIDIVAVLDIPDDQYSSIGSAEAGTGAFAPHPFEGMVEFDFTMTLLSHSVTRRARICYTHCPDWAYFDTKTGAEVIPFGEGSSFQFEIESILDSEVHYSGEDAIKRGRHVRKKFERDWEPCNDMTELGIWPDEIWTAIEDLIDKDCRAKDQANRKDHGC